MEVRKILIRILVGLGIAIIAGYSLHTFWGFLIGPRIELAGLESGYSTTTAFIVVAGRVTHTQVLSINDATTSTSLEGYFSESLLLAEGYNILEVKATDRYGRVTDKRIELTLIVPYHASSTLETATSSMHIASSTNEGATTTLLIN